MTTYLFAWNPKKWDWKEDELNAKILEVHRLGHASDRWSCGNRRTLAVGSRFFLIRLGKEPRGIVGSGTTTSPPKPRPHWDHELRQAGRNTVSVDIQFDFLSKQPQVSFADLMGGAFSHVSWAIQASGVALAPEAAAWLEALWARRTSGADPSSAEEEPSNQVFAEGAVKRVTVNAFERNPQARAACLAHFGYRCVACGLLLEAIYGPIAAEFVHVHHTVPLATVSRDYRVDAKKDLRPVCPNCHAIIHRRATPLSIDAVQKLVKKFKAKNAG